MLVCVSVCESVCETGSAAVRLLQSLFSLVIAPVLRSSSYLLLAPDFDQLIPGSPFSHTLTHSHCVRGTRKTKAAKNHASRTHSLTRCPASCQSCLSLFPDYVAGCCSDCDCFILVFSIVSLSLSLASSLPLLQLHSHPRPSFAVRIIRPFSCFSLVSLLLLVFRVFLLFQQRMDAQQRRAWDGERSK